MKQISLVGALALGAALLPAACIAQPFPSRPVTMILPFPPGGPAYLIARLIAKGMSENLGENVVVEIKSGAGGNIGAEYVARQSRPDGYTLLFATSSLASNVSLTKLNFNPRTELTPVAGLFSIPNLLVIADNAPYNTLADLVSAARNDPSALTFGSSGPGTSSHLAGELFKMIAEMPMTHVPYRGTGPVFPDVAAGRVTMVFGVFSAAVGQMKGLKLRALAISSRQRSPLLPDAPTFTEAGYPNYPTSMGGSGFMARAKTPPAAIARLVEAVSHALETPEMVDWRNNVGAERLPLQPVEFGAYFNAEIDRWSGMVKDGRLQVLQ